MLRGGIMQGEKLSLPSLTPPPGVTPAATIMTDYSRLYDVRVRLPVDPAQYTIR